MQPELAVLVGIDLPELIRLKRENGKKKGEHKTLVGIDLPELIRLKLVAVISALAVFAKSGLICLN